MDSLSSLKNNFIDQILVSEEDLQKKIPNG